MSSTGGRGGGHGSSMSAAHFISHLLFNLSLHNKDLSWVRTLFGSEFVSLL